LLVLFILLLGVLCIAFSSQPTISGPYPLFLEYYGWGHTDKVIKTQHLAGQHYFPNVTLTTQSDLITLNGFIYEAGSLRSTSETGVLEESQYYGSPFNIFWRSSLTVKSWWFFWLNQSILDQVVVGELFNVTLNQTALPPISTHYGEGYDTDWKGNESLVTTPPFPMTLNYSSSGNVIISGQTTFNTSTNYKVHRHLELNYDSNNTLTTIVGKFSLGLNQSSYEHSFYWLRQKISFYDNSTQSTTTSEPSVTSEVSTTSEPSTTVSKPTTTSQSPGLVLISLLTNLFALIIWRRSRNRPQRK
ncbi:MAG: hypothetical protein JSV04_07405, partial [Candidatus Heimdallarchaeota archaeon]